MLKPYCSKCPKNTESKNRKFATTKKEKWEIQNI